MIRDDSKLQAIAKAVGETLNRDFANIKILDVRVRPDVDVDDGDVLNIEIIFEGSPRDLDARSLSGAIRHVRPALDALGESAFPLLSFVSSIDARNRHLAGA